MSINYCEGRLNDEKEENHCDVKQVDPDLCEGTIREILIRLPAETTLITFKFVSKTWMHIITSPHFIRRHFQCCNSVSDNNNNDDEAATTASSTRNRFLVMHEPPASYYRYPCHEILATSISLTHDPEFHCRIDGENIRAGHQFVGILTNITFQFNKVHSLYQPV